MTAMSDVTVLLLTFFMLTSTFIQKEPVQVSTPGSVSEIKIPDTNILQILVDSKGKVFKLLSFFQLLQEFSRLFCHIPTSFCLNCSRIAGETQVALREGCNMFDIPKLMQVLSEILSDKYGCTIIMTAIPKDQAECKSDLA